MFSCVSEERNRMKASKLTDTYKAFIIRQGEQATPSSEF